MMRFTDQHFMSNYAVLYLAVTGIALILFGILFLIMPELLAYLVSFFFLFLGLVSIGLALRIRATEKKIRKNLDSMTDSIRGASDIFSDPFKNE
jgi:hypothetical protein